MNTVVGIAIAPVDTDELVELEDACPKCGERRMDCLVWCEDGDHVECQTCGFSYDPDEV